MNLLETARFHFALSPLPYLVAAHLVGDFILQDGRMARLKATSSMVCLCHVAAYALAFAPFVGLGMLPAWASLLIYAQHYLQDRYALHLRWMRGYGQTPPEKWPTGPLCVDQAFHIGFIALVSLFI